MMNEQIEHCLYESGLTADGCWNQLDDYAKESIERFAELIVRECVDWCDAYATVDGTAQKIAEAIKEHFGVSE